MRIGLHIPSFTTDSTLNFAEEITNVVKTADKGGMALITVMDHYFQIPPVGDAKEPMHEGYSMLNYFAGITQNVKLSTMVTGVIYRNPGFLVKQATTLDVMSKGRAYLGIGAAWFEREALGLGFTFPTLKERFERLEETLQIAKQMWSGNDGPYNGKHYQLKETICSPQPLQKPHPPILIGGLGERKTLKFVAQYGDACNIFTRIGEEQVKHKLNVLRKHCENVNRNFDEIELTSQGRIGPDASAEEILKELKSLKDYGFHHAHFSISNLYDLKNLEMVCNEIIPAVTDW
ncbi:MAG: LLM class F420-dependent oxidoreductase [Candidatus Kariarchaeaceae archaeon]